jgi:hypothetical protein
MQLVGVSSAEGVKEWSTCPYLSSSKNGLHRGLGQEDRQWGEIHSRGFRRHSWVFTYYEIKGNCQGFQRGFEKEK